MRALNKGGIKVLEQMAQFYKNHTTMYVIFDRDTDTTYITNLQRIERLDDKDALYYIIESMTDGTTYLEINDINDDLKVAIVEELNDGEYTYQERIVMDALNNGYYEEV